MTRSAPTPSPELTMERHFVLEAVRVTEQAALAASAWTGRGDNDAADRAAVEAMRSALNDLPIDGTVVIGEGERDKAPMLYIGERVGTGEGPALDIALDPLEGTTICAHAGPGALAVMAMAEKGGFLHAPDVYMDKIAVGPGLPEGVVDLDATPAENLKNLALAKGRDVSDLVIIVLDRPRHEELIARIREAGARIQLIGDGDVAGVIATARSGAYAAMYYGAGGAPEGVLAAAALRCIGGQFQGRLRFNDDAQIARAARMGIADPHKKYSLEELAHGDVIFAATGVTDGPMLEGVRRTAIGATTETILMRSITGTVRTIHAEHNFERKPWLSTP